MVRFLFILLFPFVAFAAPTEVIVHLPTERSLLPIYLSPSVDQRKEETPPEYLQVLEKALKFDLSHNGMTRVVPNTPPLDVLASTSDIEKFEMSPQWKEKGVLYALRLLFTDHSLSARLFMTGSGITKGIDNLPLTGDMRIDRKQVHRLSDLIHKTLFGTEGIASTHILYTLTRSNGPAPNDSDIWEIDYDGHGARQVTQDPGYCVTPTYLPPKTGFLPSSLLYASYRSGQSKIFIHSLRGRQEKRFSYLRGNQLMPTVSLQRDKVAFISDAAGSPDLFIQDFDPEKGALDKPRQLFHFPNSTQASPCFSPNGNRIAFVSNKDGSPRIYLLDLSHANPRPLLISKINRENTAPVWSPDGEKIAYSARSGRGDRQIWIYEISTNKEWQLTSGPGHKENPSWAPNSLHLVFSMGGELNSDLYLTNLNQRQAVKITSNEGSNVFPEWEPKSIAR